MHRRGEPPPLRTPVYTYAQNPNLPSEAPDPLIHLFNQAWRAHMQALLVPGQEQGEDKCRKKVPAYPAARQAQDAVVGGVHAVVHCLACSLAGFAELAAQSQACLP